MPPTATPTRIGTNGNWNTIATRGALSCGTQGSLGTLWCWGVGAAPVPQILAPTAVP